MRRSDLVLVILFAVVLAVAFSWPLLTRLSATGTWDWSEVAATYEAARHTVFLYEQFPLWSPYLCGGYPALGNPQTYWLSPVFLFVLLFGSVVGPKLAVVAYIAGGAIGMTLLARRLGIRYPAALVAAPIFLTSGFMGIHLSGGQFLWLTLAWAPWIFYGYVRARRHPRWLLLSAVCLTAIGLAGRSNLVAYLVLMLLTLGFMEVLTSRRSVSSHFMSWRGWMPLIHAGLVIALAFGLGAWKFVPDLMFLSDLDERLPEVTSISTTWMLQQLLARDVAVGQEYKLVSLVEYGYYVGWLPLVLALWGLMYAVVRRQAAAWLFVGIVMLAIALSGERNILEFLPVFDELRNPQRAMSMVVFVVALLTAWGLSRLPRAVQWLALVFIVFDLLTMTSPLLSREFAKVAKGEPTAPEIAIPFHQDEGFEPYPTVATNRGAKSFCPAVLRAWRPETPVLSYLHEDYRGEVYLDGVGLLNLSAYTPNQIQMQVTSSDGVRVIVNQNAAPGWRSSLGTVAATTEGLLALDMPAGDQVVTLSYVPPGMKLGMYGTLLTVLILLLTRYLTHAKRP